MKLIRKKIIFIGFWLIDLFQNNDFLLDHLQTTHVVNAILRMYSYEHKMEIQRAKNYKGVYHN